MLVRDPATEPMPPEPELRRWPPRALLCPHHCPVTGPGSPATSPGSGRAGGDAGPSVQPPPLLLQHQELPPICVPRGETLLQRRNQHSNGNGNLSPTQEQIPYEMLLLVFFIPYMHYTSSLCTFLVHLFQRHLRSTLHFDMQG